MGYADKSRADTSRELAERPEDGPTGDGPTGDEYRNTPLFDAALDKAVTIPSAVIRSHVDSVRRRNPQASPAEVLRILEREYLMVIGAAGGAVGAAAAFPSVGTGVAVALTASDVATFFASSAAFSLAVADVHGFEVDDAGRRRALLLASVLGTEGSRAVERASGGSALAWGKVLITNMPAGTLRQVNKTLTNKFLRTQLVKHGGLAVGRLVPFGIGAVVGVAGGRALGRTVISQSRRAFGPPPATFPPLIEVIEMPDAAAPPLLVPGSDSRQGVPTPGADVSAFDPANLPGDDPLAKRHRSAGRWPRLPRRNPAGKTGQGTEQVNEHGITAPAKKPRRKKSA